MNSICRNTQEHFDAWRTLPLPAEAEPEDPRFEISRAAESDFDRIYDLIDDSFGSARPRQVYDWMYRRNPHGFARCWILVDRETRQIIGSNARFPWPLNRGAESVDGYIAGDLGIDPKWQGRGIYREIWRARGTHPWAADEVVFGWPNAKSRKAHGNYGDDSTLPDPLVTRSLPLAWNRSRAAAPLLAAWPEFCLRGGGVHVEELKRFEASIESVARRSSPFAGFWCPRSADFMNWRYFEHPLATYASWVALEDENPIGFCVVKLSGDRAMFMDLEVAPGRPGAARALLRSAIRAARRADCRAIDCTATPSFIHWPRLRRVGFLSAQSTAYMLVRSRAHADARRIENWNLSAGDLDAL